MRGDLKQTPISRQTAQLLVSRGKHSKEKLASRAMHQAASAGRQTGACGTCLFLLARSFPSLPPRALYVTLLSVEHRSG